MSADSFFLYMASRTSSLEKRAVYTLLGRLDVRLQKELAYLDVEVFNRLDREAETAVVEVREKGGCVYPTPLVVRMCFEIPTYSKHPSYSDTMMRAERTIFTTVLCAVRAPAILELGEADSRTALDLLRKKTSGR